MAYIYNKVEAVSGDSRVRQFLIKMKKTTFQKLTATEWQSQLKESYIEYLINDFNNNYLPEEGEKLIGCSQIKAFSKYVIDRFGDKDLPMKDNDRKISVDEFLSKNVNEKNAEALLQAVISVLKMNI